MRVSLLDYDLPEGRIAQHPTRRREDARVLVVHDGAALEDRTISDLPGLIASGSLIVLNDTKVLHARLAGIKATTGGKVELLLVRRLASGPAISEERWEALGRGLSPLRSGLTIEVGTRLRAEIEDRLPEGLVVVRLYTLDGTSVVGAIEAFGQVPIPPYLQRQATPEDSERYQTVYARVPGAVAAPTAGLHLTEAILNGLREAGVRTATLTLHVGPGTFRPVKVDDLRDHTMHSEWFEIGAPLAQEIAAARRRHAPVIAIGTTVVRALESAADPGQRGHVRAMRGETNLLIAPGYEFRVVDGLLTNFHLPRSTLLALVAAFAGLDVVLNTYREAVRRDYRFYSYGDAMWIPNRKCRAAEAATCGDDVDRGDGSASQGGA